MGLSSFDVCIIHRGVNMKFRDFLNEDRIDSLKSNIESKSEKLKAMKIKRETSQDSEKTTEEMKLELDIKKLKDQLEKLSEI